VHAGCDCFSRGLHAEGSGLGCGQVGAGGEANLLEQLQKQLGLRRASGLPQGERPAVADDVDMLLPVCRGLVAGLLHPGLHPPRALSTGCWSINSFSSCRRVNGVV